MELNRNVIFIFLFAFSSCGDTSKKEYFDNGKLKSVTPFKEGFKNGKFLEYFDNGQLKYEIPYVYDSIFGEAYEYDSLGNLISNISYRANKKDGSNITYYSSGKLKMKGQFEDGTPVGLFREYHESGLVKVEAYYVKGKLSYYKSFDDLGILVDSKLPIQIRRVDSSPHDCQSLANVEISLAFSSLENYRLGAILGNLDSNNELVDTLDIIGSNNSILGYQMVPYDWSNMISGVLYEVEMPSEEIKGAYFFKYDFSCKH